MYSTYLTSQGLRVVVAEDVMPTSWSRACRTCSCGRSARCSLRRGDSAQR